jgi:hypothetical protein
VEEGGERRLKGGRRVKNEKGGGRWGRWRLTLPLRLKIGFISDQ